MKNISLILSSWFGSSSRWIKKRNRKEISLICVFTLVIFYSLTLSATSCLRNGVWCGQDIDQYKDYSDSLRTGHGFSSKNTANVYYLDLKTNTTYVPEVLRLPSYSILLTIGRVFFNSPLLVLIYNYIFFVILIIYSLLLMRIFFSGWWVPITFVCIAWNPTYIFWTSVMGNTDTFAACTLIGCIYHVLQIYIKKNIWLHVILAMIFGILSVFSRGNIVIFLLPFLFLQLMYVFITKTPRNVVRMLLLIFFVICLSLIGWILRNYTLTNKPVLSSYTGLNLFAEHIYFSPYKTDDSNKLVSWFFAGEVGPKFIASEVKKGRTVPQAITDLSDSLQKRTIEYLSKHPDIAMYQYITEVKAVFIGSTFTWEKHDILYELRRVEKKVNGVFLYLSFLFPVILFFSKNKKKYWLLTLWVSYIFFTCVSAFVHGITMGNRGTLPVYPLVVLFSFLSILLLYEILRCYDIIYIIFNQKKKGLKNIRTKKK